MAGWLYIDRYISYTHTGPSLIVSWLNKKEKQNKKQTAAYRISLFMVRQVKKKMIIPTCDGYCLNLSRHRVYTIVRQAPFNIWTYSSHHFLSISSHDAESSLFYKKMIKIEFGIIHNWKSVERETIEIKHEPLFLYIV